MIELESPPFVDRLQWFAGDRDALDLYERLVYIAHAWDDLIDQDKHVDVGELMANLLLYLPTNPCYRKYEGELRALFMVGMIGYNAANQMESVGDAHRLEIAHYLRYSVMNIAIFLFGALNGLPRAAQILVEAAPVMLPERLADYLKEHNHGIQPA